MFIDLTRFLIVGLLVVSPLTGLLKETRLLRYPDIHQNTIVFCYGGDLYLASSDGKNVKQLTSFPGEEMLPKFSPDGRRIAFTAEFEGNKDVYVMSVQGGKPKRLTFHPAAEYVVDWHPDGKQILFRSNGSSTSYRFNRLHSVPAQGGLPTVLELPEADLSSFNDTGDRIAFCRTSLENSFKGYRGGALPDIWTYDFVQQKAKLAISDPSINHHPLWIGDDIYFVSDRGRSKEQNLWVYDGTSKESRQITFFQNWGVQWPSKGKDQIVFENEGRLCIYNIKDKTIRPIKIEIPPSQNRLTAGTKNVQDRISGSPALSPDGKKVILSVRGALFYLEPEKNLIRNLTQAPGVNERNPVWSPDGRSYAYISDVSGEDQIYIRKFGDSLKPIQITNIADSRVGNLKWAPDGKKIGFADKRAAYYYVDLETKIVKKVFFDAYLESVNFVTAAWSPDGNWLAYASGNPNWYSSIHLFSLEDAKAYRVTDEYSHAFEPQFDPEGKFLYWIADSRIHVEDSYWDGGHYRINPSSIVAATLQKEPLAPMAAAPGSAPAAQEPQAVPIRIDVEGLGQRVMALPIEDSSYKYLAALKGRLIYLSEPAKGESAIKMFDLAAQKESVLLKDAWYCIPAARADKIVYRAEGTIGILDIKPGQKAGAGRIDLSGLNLTVDYGKEWKQIFEEAWRIQRDFFFDENLHGVDWAAMKRKYAALLPHVASRQDLNRLIADLFSELGQSHMEISGGDLPEIPKVNNGLLGIDLELDIESRLYRIAKIYGGHTRDVEKRGPLTLPGMNIKQGDYLLAIDGTSLKEGVNPDSLLVNKAGVAVALTVHDKPTLAGSRTVKVTPADYSEQLGDLLRYDDWVWGNIERVSQATGGKVGYIHLPDTYIPGMESFFRFFYPQLDKQALILDVRFNGGGYPPIWMIERLNRKLIYYSHFPYGKAPLREPDPVFGGALVCLANEWSKSAGEVFAATFRQMDCGLLVGRRTSGSLASTGGYRLVDGGVLVYPAEGKQNGQGESVIENIGVSPDIDVINRPDDMIKNKDAQLERAIEEIMKQSRAEAKDH